MSPYEPQAVLRCDGCGATAGAYGSYEAWEDAARRLGWYVGEELVLCDVCTSGTGGEVWPEP